MKRNLVIYNITHIHRYLYSNIKLRRNVDKRTLDKIRCKLGYHEWVALHSYEYRQRPRRAIFSHKGGRKKAQYYTKRKTEYYCNNCGRKK